MSASKKPFLSRDALVRIAPFAVFIFLMAVEPFLADVVVPWMDPRWLYAVRCLVTAAVLLAFWSSYVEVREGPGAGLGTWGLALGVGVAVFGLWIVLDVPGLVLGEAEGPFDPRVDDRIHLGFALTRLAGSALVVPVMEELFWRSFLMRWLEKTTFLHVDPRSVGLRSLLLASVVFALEHRLWFAGLLAGLAYGELYRRTGSLWVVIVAHGLTNLLLGLWVLRTGTWAFW